MKHINRWIKQLSFSKKIFLLGLFTSLIAISSLLGAIWLYRNSATEFWAGFLTNAGTELLSIAITVLILNVLYQRADNERIKQQLIRELGSLDNGIATRAANELRANGWLEDGTLQGADLRRANLQNAILENADLQRADLSEAQLQDTNLQWAKLQGADLEKANLRRAMLDNADLQDANLGDTDMQWAFMTNTSLKGAALYGSDLRGALFLSDMQLAKVWSLHRAELPLGKKYDGRYNLEVDIASARIDGIDIYNPEIMATYYGVSSGEYLIGQEWAKENLSNLESEEVSIEEIRQTGQVERVKGYRIVPLIEENENPIEFIRRTTVKAITEILDKDLDEETQAVAKFVVDFSRKAWNLTDEDLKDFLLSTWEAPPPQPSETSSLTNASMKMFTHQLGATFQVSAWVQNPSPNKHSNQKVYGQLIKDGKGIANAQMFSVVHYKTASRRIPKSGFVITDRNGIASTQFNIGSVSARFTIKVDVYLRYEGQIYLVTTSFIPN